MQKKMQTVLNTRGGFQRNIISITYDGCHKFASIAIRALMILDTRIAILMSTKLFMISSVADISEKKSWNNNILFLNVGTFKVMISLKFMIS